MPTVLPYSGGRTLFLCRSRARALEFVLSGDSSLLQPGLSQGCPPKASGHQHPGVGSHQEGILGEGGLCSQW